MFLDTYGTSASEAKQAAFEKAGDQRRNQV
jgi:hypothetical protein